MTCRDCDKKTSRHARIHTMPKDLDQTEPRLGQGFSVEDPLGGQTPNQGPPDPFTTFLAARNLSYDDIMARKQFQQEILEKQSEAVMAQMTNDMRQVHLEELIAVVNCEGMSVPGMSPGQAIVVLKESLDKKEFSFADDLYPGLREVVTERYVEIRAQRLPGRKKK